MSRPGGVDQKDTLRDFHEAMAVQATSQQVSQFSIVLKRTDTAKAALQKLLQAGAKVDPSPASSAPQSSGVEISLGDALENASTESKKFVEGFSAKQKSGLKDSIKRLERADAALEEERKTTAQNLQTMSPGSPEIVSRAQSLNRALTEFSDQEVSLGKEMGIVLASGEDQTFRLLAVRNTVLAGGQTMGVPIAGVLSQVSAEGGQRTFKVEMTADLTDLQQNITEVLRRQIERSEDCGERLALRRATITPSTPASVLDLQLHYERWSCIRLYGQSTSNELAESDGSVEIKLTPAVDSSNAVKLVSAFARIDASGMMADSLRSGDLGESLRERVSQAVLSVVSRGANPKASLPPVVQNSIAVRSARFQDAGAGVLSVMLEGQAQMSDDQVKVLADQLNQTLSAQAPLPQ